MKAVKITLLALLTGICLAAFPAGHVQARGLTPAEWYQPECTAWDNIYGALYNSYDSKSFTDGTFLNECLNDNLEPGGVMMYLDYGYFTPYVAQLKALGRIPADYQLPQKPYTITKTGGTVKMGAYKAPRITTDCPEAMARYNFWVNYYTSGTTAGGTGAAYVPKYKRDAQTSAGAASAAVTTTRSVSQIQAALKQSQSDFQKYMAAGDKASAAKEAQKYQALLKMLQ
jgi:hypothetical protein